MTRAADGRGRRAGDAACAPARRCRAGGAADRGRAGVGRKGRSRSGRRRAAPGRRCCASWPTPPPSRFLLRVRRAAARNFGPGARAGPAAGLARAMAETFDAAGEIRDDASPELARLRGERHSLQDRARSQIELLMRDDEYAPVMQDQFFTIRAERYVLPLKASAKSMGLRNRARHVAHRRDGVRRADGAGRGEQPVEGDRAGDPPRVATDSGDADRRGGGGGAGAAPHRHDDGGDRRARGGGAAGARLRRQSVAIVDEPLARSARRAPPAAGASPTRRSRPGWSPTIWRWGAAARRS